MKLEFQLKDEDIVERRKAQQEKKVIKVLINSIEPKPNHLLFEFHPVEDGFRVFQTNWKQPKEIVYVNVNGNWIERKEDVKKPFIEIKEGVCYITALNYSNAVKKFKLLNSHLF